MTRGLAFIAMTMVAVSAIAAPATITNAWARATPPGATVAAVYAQLATARADEVIAIASPAAERVEIHVSTQENGIAKMRQVERLRMSAGVPIKLEPGGYHLMLFGLREPLVAGRSLPVAFTFRDAGKLTIQARIVGPGENPPS